MPHLRQPKKPKLDYHRAFKYHEAMTRPNFEFAPQDEIDKLSIFVGDIIRALSSVMDAPPAMYVSDESKIGDFCLEPEELEKLSKKLGVPMKDEDLIIDVAQRMRKIRKP